MTAPPHHGFCPVLLREAESRIALAIDQATEAKISHCHALVAVQLRSKDLSVCSLSMKAALLAPVKDLELKAVERFAWLGPLCTIVDSTQMGIRPDLKDASVVAPSILITQDQHKSLTFSVFPLRYPHDKESLDSLKVDHQFQSFNRGSFHLVKLPSQLRESTSDSGSILEKRSTASVTCIHVPIDTLNILLGCTVDAINEIYSPSAEVLHLIVNSTRFAEFRLDSEGLALVRHFTFRPEVESVTNVEFAAFCSNSTFVFALHQPSEQIFIWTTGGNFISSFSLNLGDKVDDPKGLESAHTRLKVAKESTFLYVWIRGGLYCIDLDRLYMDNTQPSRPPVHIAVRGVAQSNLMKEFSQTTSEYARVATGMRRWRNQYTRWFDRAKSASGLIIIDQKNQKQSSRNTTPFSRQTRDLVSQENCPGLLAFAESTTLIQEENIQEISPHTRGFTFLVRHTDGRHQLKYYDPKQKAVTQSYSFTKPTISVVVDESIWYFLSQDNLTTVLSNAKQQQIIDNTITFESAAVADYLCRLNKWNQKFLLLHSLNAGLRYRQLEVIDQALQRLEQDQEMQGLNALLDATKELSQNLVDQDYCLSLVHIGVAFASKLIQRQVDSLSSIPDYSSQEFNSNLFNQDQEHASDSHPALKQLRDTCHAAHQLQGIKLQLEGASQAISQSQKRSSVNRLSVSLDAPLESVDSGVAQSDHGPNTIFGTLTSQDNQLRSSQVQSQQKVHSLHSSAATEVKSHQQVIEEALMGGSVSLALAQLNSVAAASGSPAIDFQFVQNVGFLLAYRLLVEEKLDQAQATLMQLGEDWRTHFRSIFFMTLSPRLRKLLYAELKRIGSLTEEENAAYQIVHALEREYPNTSAKVAHRIRFEALTQDATMSPVDGPVSEVSDIYDEHVMGLGLQLDSHLGSGSEDEQLNSSAYAQLSVGWVAMWNRETTHRLLKEASSTPMDVKPSNLYQYLLDHNDWVGLRDFLATHYGDGLSKDPDLLVYIYASLDSSPIYMAEYVRSIMSNHGIFTSEGKDAADHMRQLARTGHLFLPTQHRASKPELSTNLPMTQTSTWHAQHVQYMIEADLPVVLQAYIDHYKLSLSRESLHACVTESNRRPWIDLVSEYRLEPGSFHSMIVNAKFVLKLTGTDGDYPSLTYMALRERPLMLLSALSLLDQNVSACHSLPEDSPKHLDEKVFQDVIKAYPTLCRALQSHKEAEVKQPKLRPMITRGCNLSTWKGDIDLYHLLQLTSHRSIPLFELLQQLDKAEGVGYAADQLVSHDDLHKEELDFSYFLCRGRPTEAFLVLMTECPIDEMGKPSIPPNQQDQLVTAVINFCLSPTADERLIGSCIYFLQLCGLADERLFSVIDVHHLLAKYSPSHCDEFIRCVSLYGSSEFDETAANTLSRVLEEAAEEYASSISQDDELVESTLAPWHSIIRFCQQHKINVSPILTAVAKSNSWVSLLSFMGQLSVDDNLLKDLVQHLPSEALKKHILIAIRDLLQQSDSNPPTLSETPKEVENSQEGHVSWSSFFCKEPFRAFLQAGVDMRKPEYIIIATLFDNQSAARCLLAWLLSQHASQLDAEGWTSASSDEKTLDILGRSIIRILRSQTTQALETGLSIFDPQTPLLSYLGFEILCSQRRFEDATVEFKNFSAMIHSEKPNSKLPKEFLVKITGDLTASLVKMYTAIYEKCKLLHILGTSPSGEHWKKVAFTADILSSVGLHLDCESEPADVLSMLIDNEHYELARSFASYHSLSPHRITVDECRLLIKHMQQGSLWNMDIERQALWKKCDEKLLENNCFANIAGDFFLEQVDSLKETLTSTELAQLLSYALHWFNGTASKESPCRSTEVLGDLENRILLLNVAAETSVVPSWLLSVSSQALASGAATPKDSASASRASVTAENQHQAGEMSKGEFLTKAIIRLLGDRNLNQARRICQQFKHSSIELEVVETALQIAKGTLPVSRIPENLTSLLVSHDSAFDPKSISTLKAIEALSQIQQGSQDYCRYIQVNYLAAKLLSMPYDEVNKQDPSSILQRLLSLGKEHYQLCKGFASTHRIANEKVARVVSQIFYKSLLRYHADGTIGNDIDPNCSKPEFLAFVALSRDLSEVGAQFLKLISAESMPYMCEVEMFIRAHYCFIAAINVEGASTLLQTAAKRIPEYVKSGDFRLLTRLLIGTNAFHELEIIFDMLLDHNQFDLLLSTEGKANEGKDDIRLALASYLKTNHSSDVEKLNKVYARFNMHREIGDYFTEKAHQVIEQVMDKYTGSSLPRAEAAKLLDAAQYLLDGAENYFKDECSKLGDRNNALVGLITLQMSLLNEKVLSLTVGEARTLMASRAQFHEALVIAHAYDLNRIPEWILPVYQQVILGGNFKFFTEFRQIYSPNPSFYLDLCKRFKSDSQKQDASDNMRKFIDKHVTSCSRKIEMAQMLGLQVRRKNDAISIFYLF
eukprot:TRINITY_DN5728_c0_g1_i4.p1 TRINITY_DN5728_c0_g1~~TRINITY_DN5728_c0_g1_i4.p1  ORF type:complete len:2440 (+),score=461.38 TRINITY_DN5728_c0_g1_i4:99-7418(+)